MKRSKWRNIFLIFLLPICDQVVGREKQIEECKGGQFALHDLVSVKPAIKKSTKKDILSLQLSDGNTLRVILRLAQPDDLEAVLSVYQEMTEVDKKSVITFPEIYQRTFLQESIRQRHLFVAITPRGKVAALLKLFLVKDEATAKHIASNELRLAPSLQLPAPVLREVRLFYSKTEELGNYAIPLRTVTLQNNILLPPAALDVTKTAIIYCGSCLARQEYRGCGLATHLEAFAFNSVCAEVKMHLKKFSADRICLLFGKVHQTYSHQGLIRSFMSFIATSSEFMKKRVGVILRSWSFLANLPSFKLSPDGLLLEEKVPSVAWKDYGCAFVYDMV